MKNLFFILGLAAHSAPAAPASPWAAAWCASPSTPFHAQLLSDQTLRMFLRPTISGKSVRIRFTNLYGEAPLKIGEAHLATRARGARTIPGSDHTLTFGGKSSAEIAKGETLLSDPLPFAAEAFRDLALSIYFREKNLAQTTHNFAYQSAFISEPGNHAGEDEFGSSREVTFWAHVQVLEVLPTKPAPGIVAFGDSLTDGTGSTPNANHRWPDFLAARLAAAHKPLPVLNAGIWGNSLLRASSNPKFPLVPGDAALRRLDRDALDLPGARFLIVVLGTNDIGDIKVPASPEKLIEAYKEIARRAHAKKFKAFLATLMPFGKGQPEQYPTTKEKDRQTINAWIRHNKSFDGVIDFDAAVRDPQDPEKVRAGFDSGDTLHLSDAGYEAAANSIDLGLFKLKP